MTLRLYLLRHGQTAMSRANVFCGRGLDPVLTDEGITMAESFAAAYRERQWTAIYSSPLQRAITTARPLAKAVGLQIEEREELSEIDYGMWDGLTAEVVARASPFLFSCVRPPAARGVVVVRAGVDDAVR